MDVTRKALWHGLLTSLLWASALTGCGVLSPSPAPPCTSGAPTIGSPPTDSRDVRSLHRQLREREKRLAEVEFQLEALKRIDQDRQKQRRVRRPSATVTPLE